MSSPSVVVTGTRELTLSQAVNEALAEELRRDSTVFLIGEDVAEAGHPFKVLSGLVEEFGCDRVIDSPIAEAGISGLGLGAAITGMRPVVDIMFGDFLTLIKHSQSLHAWVAHIPGLKVCLPSTPADAKGLLKSAIRDDNPVVIFEDKMMYAVKGLVPDGDHLVPIGLADVKREGDDVTVIATSSMVLVALDAAAELERDGVSVEVVDPRTIAPLDRATLVASARKTGRVIVVDEGHQSYGASAELAAVIAEDAFWHLDAPVVRFGAMDVPIPFSPVLEDETVPTPERVADAVLRLLGRGR